MPPLGSYLVTAHLSRNTYEAAGGGTLRCLISGGREDPYTGDLDEVTLPTGGQLELQFTLRVTELPIMMHCSTIGLTEGERVYIVSYQLDMIKLDSRPMG